MQKTEKRLYSPLWGVIYSKGVGVTPSFEKALYWYRKGVEANQSRAMHNLCVYYLNGIAVNEDYFEVIFYNNRAQAEGYYRFGNQNIPKIVGELAQTSLQSLIDGSKNAKALADKNDPEGLYRYGMCFEFGIQNVKKIDMALNCYARSAQASYMPAMLKTALLYFHGGESDNNITFKDEKRALYWFAKASEKNNQTADYYIAYCYENGIVLQKNVDEALKWYKKAAGRDQYQAHERLSEIYGEGIYMKKIPI